MHLPEKFQKEMEILLGDEYQAFKESYDRQPENGLRLNRRKVTGEEFLTRSPFLLKKIPWIDNGYTYETGTPAKDPYYYAGLYYLQEPSAMTPANRLSPEPGDYVLDLCAAPGGKATELGAKLNGEGLLLANDISNSRAKALLKNLELMGIPNIYVTSETSEKLAKILPEFFDKILVDAPCSGEGMFRKEPRPDMKLIPCAPYEGFAKGRRGLEACVRIFPHRMNGEGHFLALLEKQGEPRNRKKATGKNSAIPTEAKEFLENWGMYKREWQYYLRDERLYALGKKDGMPENLRYLRTGLYLGECKKKRFEPSQALAMVLDGEGENRIHLNRDDPRVIRYLKGETLDVSDLDLKKRKGWQLVCVDEYPLGWGKLAGGSLKNKYYAGWRWQ